jgi:hypothetical protein
MNNIQKALYGKKKNYLDTLGFGFDTTAEHEKYTNHLEQLIESLYNIVEGEKVDYKGTTVGCSIYSEGYNNCKKEILSKFNDKLGIEEE